MSFNKLALAAALAAAPFVAAQTSTFSQFYKFAITQDFTFTAPNTTVVKQAEFHGCAEACHNAGCILLQWTQSTGNCELFPLNSQVVASASSTDVYVGYPFSEACQFGGSYINFNDFTCGTCEDGKVTNRAGTGCVADYMSAGTTHAAVYNLDPTGISSIDGLPRARNGSCGAQCLEIEDCNFYTSANNLCRFYKTLTGFGTGAAVYTSFLFSVDGDESGCVFGEGYFNPQGVCIPCADGTITAADGKSCVAGTISTSAAASSGTHSATSGPSHGASKSYGPSKSHGPSASHTPSPKPSASRKRYSKERF